MQVDVRIVENVLSDGINVYVATRTPGERQFLWFDYQDSGPVGTFCVPMWNRGDPATSAPSPTFTVPDDVGRAILEALMRHYSGSQDLHTLRADFMHERDRRDRLEEVVMQIAAREV